MGSPSAARSKTSQYNLEALMIWIVIDVDMTDDVGRRLL